MAIMNFSSDIANNEWGNCWTVAGISTPFNYAQPLCACSPILLCGDFGRHVFLVSSLPKMILMIERNGFGKIFAIKPIFWSACEWGSVRPVDIFSFFSSFFFFRRNAITNRFSPPSITMPIINGAHGIHRGCDCNKYLSDRACAFLCKREILFSIFYFRKGKFAKIHCLAHPEN